MKETAVSVLFGTQTGNSLGVAKRIQRLVTAKGYSSTVQCMNQWHHVNWKSTDVVVFVTSSFGVGSAPDNANEFEAMLKESLSNSDESMERDDNSATKKDAPNSSTLPSFSQISQTHFAVLGLGHKLWPNFCAFPKFVDKRLEQLGGLRMIDRGDADDGHPSGRDAVIDPWIAKFMKKLVTQFPPSPTPTRPPSLHIPMSTPDIEDLSSLPLRRFASQSPLANRLRKTPTSRGSGGAGRDDNAVSVRSPRSFGSDLLCNTCHLDREVCSYECLSESKQPELVHYKHPDCFEAPVVEARLLTRTPEARVLAQTSEARVLTQTPPCTLPMPRGSPASPLVSTETQVSEFSPQTSSRIPMASPNAQISSSSRESSISELSHKVEAARMNETSTDSRSSRPSPSVSSRRTDDLVESPPPEVFHLKLDLGQMRGAHFEPGDSIGIRCPNDIFAASFIFERLAVPPEMLFRPANYENSFPPPTNLPTDCTIMDALMFFVDVTHCVSDACLDDLVECTSDVEEARSLRRYIRAQHELAADGKMSTNSNSPLSLLEILRCFPSCKPTVGLLYRHLSSTPLQPRFYSVASSPLVSERLVEFAVSVTPRGVCSTYLRRIARRLSRRRDCASASLLRLPIFIRPELKTHFRLPSDVDRPMIFIGAGTGVAPLRGMLLHLQEISKRKTAASPSVSVCDNAHFGTCQAIPAPPPPRWAIFGFRHEDVDFLYRPDLENLRNGGVVSKMDVCFSRNQDFSPKEGSDIRYVQHVLQARGAELLEFLRSKRAMFFVCGSRAMESAVRKCFVDILADSRSGRSRIPLGPTLAREKVHQLIQRLQYRAESWS